MYLIFIILHFMINLFSYLTNEERSYYCQFIEYVLPKSKSLKFTGKKCIYTDYRFKQFWITMFFHIYHILFKTSNFWFWSVFFFKSKQKMTSQKMCEYKFVELSLVKNFASKRFFVSCIVWLKNEFSLLIF